MGNLLDKLRKLYMKETALSSRPQETENSRQYLLLRADIVKKTVVVCPLKFYISSFNLAKTHARPLTKIEKHIPYFCFPVYKRLYRSAYLTQSLVELLPILRGFSTKEGDNYSEI